MSANEPLRLYLTRLERRCQWLNERIEALEGEVEAYETLLAEFRQIFAENEAEVTW